MKQLNEFFFVLGTCNFAIHVGELKKFDRFDDGEQILFFFKLSLLKRRESYNRVDVFHYWDWLI